MSPLPIVLAALLLVAADPVKTYKKELSKISHRQKVYEAKGLDEDLRDAYATFRAPWRQRGGPDAPKVIDYDFSGYDSIYERWEDYADEKGLLAQQLASIDGEDVAERLVTTLLDVLREIEVYDKAILAGKPKNRSIHNLVPGIKRNGCWLHRDALVDAMGSLRERKATAYLSAKGWSKAEKWDRSHRSVRARAALIDSMALAGGQQAFLESRLKSKAPEIRIAALEALAGLLPAPVIQTALRLARDNDPCWAVRETARSLLGETIKMPENAPTFGGIKVASKRAIVVLEAGWSTIKPLDIELLKTKTYREWRSVAEKDRTWLSQIDWMKNEAFSFIAAMSPDAHFNILLMNQNDRVVPLVPKGAIPADRKGRKRAELFIDEILPGGSASQLQGFWEACRLAGSAPYGTAPPEEPAVDTVVLCSDGVPRAGPLLYAPAILDEFQRAYRFHRIRVHTVRIDDAAEPAERVMKGIAEATNGTYVHKTK